MLEKLPQKMNENWQHFLTLSLIIELPTIFQVFFSPMAFLAAHTLTGTCMKNYSAPFNDKFPEAPLSTRNQRDFNLPALHACGLTWAAGAQGACLPRARGSRLLLHGAQFKTRGYELPYFFQ